MMEKIRFSVKLDRPFYQPGQTILGHVICDPHQPIEIDSVVGYLRGEVHFFHNFLHKTRTIVDESCQLWKYQTVSEMLGLDDFIDENQNHQFSSDKASSSFTSPTTFPIRIQVPKNAPPTFHCPGSPVSVRFVLEIQLFNQNLKIAAHEENLVVLNFDAMKRHVAPRPVNVQKIFHFSKERSIAVDMRLTSDVFTTTARIENHISVCNRWKQSLKYVHLNIVRRISALNEMNEIIETVQIDTTGVGLPSGKNKISVGETLSFTQLFNIPALPPNTHVNGLFKTDYSLKVSIGRAHNFVLLSFEIPITISTTEENERRSYRKGEEVLVDISSSNSCAHNQMPIDLLV